MASCRRSGNSALDSHKQRVAAQFVSVIGDTTGRSAEESPSLYPVPTYMRTKRPYSEPAIPSRQQRTEHNRMLLS